MQRGFIIILILVILSFLLYRQFQPSVLNIKELTYSEFINEVENNRVSEINIKGESVYGKLLDDTKFKSYVFIDSDLLKKLNEKKIKITIQPAEQEPLWKAFLFTWLPTIFIIFLFVLMFRQMQAAGGKAFNFGKSRAKLINEDKQKVTFKDVAGIDEVKEELKEIIDFLKDHKKYTRLGGRIPKGVLLVGPPGTGKTLLARAIAGEAGVPFYNISGSDFVEMFVGVGAARVRDLFETAKKNAPCILFIDEIDAVGRHRGAGLGGGHDEREQTLNQLLVEMDGFETGRGIILIAATNRPDILDPALLRPGRFDRRIVVPPPDVKGREEILKVHTRKIPMDKDVDVTLIARGTAGFTGADIENLVNEAALLAAKKNKDNVNMDDFEEAKDKVLMGVARRSMIISDTERKTTAYHEAGHTLVAKKLPGTDPIHKVTIIPRGMALGLTQQLPIDDRHIYSKEYLLNTITVLMGGRVAEELVFKHITTGAGNDIERATEIASKMVCEWGMSEKLGPLSYGRRDDMVFLGREIVHQKDYSEITAQEIDSEIRRIVNDCYNTAKNIINENFNILQTIAQKLLEKEILDNADIEKIIRQHELQEGKPQQAPAEVRS